MQSQKNIEKTGSKKEILKQGKVIKVIESLDFGVIQTEDSEFLFFHIGNFIDEDITIEDIKEGDVIICKSQTQKSDGRQAAINCKRVELKVYLKDYFIKNALIAPGDVELFDEFCENAMEYARYIIDGDVDIGLVRKITDQILEGESVMNFKVLRPDIAILSGQHSNNKTFVELMYVFDEVIKKISPKSEDDIELVNFKSFTRILMSYVKTLI